MKSQIDVVPKCCFSSETQRGIFTGHIYECGRPSVGTVNDTLRKAQTPICRMHANSCEKRGHVVSYWHNNKETP